jgi:hypothetical protein
MVLIHKILSYPILFLVFCFLNVLGLGLLFSFHPFGLAAVTVGYFVAKIALPYCYMYCVPLPSPPLVR